MGSGTARYESARSSRIAIAEAIVDLIVSRQLVIGELTSEVEIATKLGFNARTPVVREALALLGRDGIIEQRPQIGQRVRPLTGEDAKEILELLTTNLRSFVRRLAAPDRLLALE